MRLLVSWTLVCLMLAAIATPPAQAQDVCGQLWVARNSIYKQYGLCFRTAQAIRYFGNAGCIYDSPEQIRMSRHDRQRVQAIVARERDLGC
jgi:hypothetical protein